MHQYIGLDVSLKDTAISIRQEGKRIWRGKLTRTLVVARSQLVSISKQLSNQIRGLMKTFDLIVPKGAGRVFDVNARGLLDGNNGLAAVILPLLEAWRDIRKRAANLDHQLLAASKQSQATKLLKISPPRVLLALGSA
ncbi:Hypothetical protein NGAL_HAMBI2610_48280 [Neorhizobium galegae bv. orientalis]|nr:Hypothetical protein NGAL_HAMBI2610_48280 [Neorhizobium galegae bv. orientalis]